MRYDEPIEYYYSLTRPDDEPVGGEYYSEEAAHAAAQDLGLADYRINMIAR